ncbi:hypothetical protein BP5796_07158 [Coleophoma crateriformis]|uniref:LysM domain-containing protein n=1 Tax=Coleophoma crateriformis TaxID=565419 RepID=A0A3D8RID1_9HELO|nr:hypothetical protein BP5796_07158 [Coleophoma crateriformis]
MQLLTTVLFAGLATAAVIPHAVRQLDPCRIVTNVTVAQGDTLTNIAAAKNTTLDAILQVNPSITNANLIYPGEVIAIPSSQCVGTTTSTPPATAICSASTTGPYTVVSGDTLSAIAAQFGITLAALEAANPQIANFDLIQPGQPINIPACGTCSRNSTGTYSVVSGDTLTKIAGQFGLTLAALEAANSQIANFDIIHVADEIHVPICSQGSSLSSPTPAPVASTCSTTTTGTYSVVSGDTLSAIAAHFGLTLAALEAANPAVTNPDLIFVGQLLYIPVCASEVLGDSLGDDETCDA